MLCPAKSKQKLNPAAQFLLTNFHPYPIGPLKRPVTLDPPLSPGKPSTSQSRATTGTESSQKLTTASASSVKGSSELAVLLVEMPCLRFVDFFSAPVLPQSIDCAIAICPYPLQHSTPIFPANSRLGPQGSARNTPFSVRGSVTGAEVKDSDMGTCSSRNDQRDQTKNNHIYFWGGRPLDARYQLMYCHKAPSLPSARIACNVCSKTVSASCAVVKIHVEIHISSRMPI